MNKIKLLCVMKILINYKKNYLEKFKLLYDY